ncbi:MAG: Uma2 family endonuclease [Phaeodactylibacter sp.]|nr:Uma2 family endonuclease [Phaeodactylibacter sp.]MCB9286336.1 Uma2 family endonuclease [Lewinellaceae bacterium]
MESAVKTIPDALIYEMVDGKPVYYKGYKDYLSGKKQIEELTGSSYLQALIGTQLIILLSRLIDLKKYQLISNEVGLKFSKQSWRAADLAIYEKETLKDIPKVNKYLEVPPKIVIEIDTKADLEEIQNPLGYYHEKTDQLLEFGVKKVIWIFTDTQKIMIARQSEDWQIADWSKNIEILEGIEVNIVRIIEEN